ncbi:glycosyltransferase family 1 protein, partial [bacterium]|nr:glycosyltransferase family 1 protein [bacterium]
MKLLFLSYSVDIGGLETYILRFGKWLSNNYPEHQIHVVCKSGFYGSYEEDFRAQGIKLYSISMGYFNLKPYFIFCRLLASKNYDVVCDFTGEGGGLTMFFSSISKVSKRIVFYRNARNSFVSNVFKRFYQYFINS